VDSLVDNFLSDLAEHIHVSWLVFIKGVHISFESIHPVLHFLQLVIVEPELKFHEEIRLIPK